MKVSFFKINLKIFKFDNDFESYIFTASKKTKTKTFIYVVSDVLMIGLGGINKTGKNIF